MASLPKHEKYIQSYKSNEIFWGLGIENETYLQLGFTEKKARFLKTNHKRERYSVDYWTIYKDHCENRTLTNWVDSLPDKEETPVKLPVLMNAHSLLSTDSYGNHKTTYEHAPKPNPAFGGKTLYENLCEKAPAVFKDQKEISWTFDGDTIEFMTQNFYNTKMEDVIDELLCLKRGWLEAFNMGIQMIERELLLHTTFKFPTKNHGFALFLTNRQNLAIFNNGTYHFNLTIPSQLGVDATIQDFALFQKQHQAAAQMFQWITPLLVAKFGSPEVLASLGSSSIFPKGSQRLCVSRFVSCGTYDTESMIPGKILQIENNTGQHEWYDSIYDNPSIGYVRLAKIGVDINFHKHLNHGLEFRIFDEFPETEIPNLFRLLIWMCDEALSRSQIENPKKNTEWNNVLSRAVLEGHDASLTENECKIFSTILKLPEIHSPKLLDIYDILWETWCSRWNASKNTCTELMIRTPLPISSDLTKNNTLFEETKINPTEPVTKEQTEIQTEIQTEKPVEKREAEPIQNTVLLSSDMETKQVVTVSPNKWFYCWC